MITRQYWDYIGSDGKRRSFLLMRNEYDEAQLYMSELGWSLRKCFERQTGLIDVTKIVLTIDMMEEPT